MAIIVKAGTVVTRKTSDSTTTNDTITEDTFAGMCGLVSTQPEHAVVDLGQLLLSDSSGRLSAPTPTLCCYITAWTDLHKVGWG